MTTDGASAGPRAEARELGEEVRGIAEDLRDLARSEVELARAVLREELRLVMGIAIAGAIALMTGVLSLVFFGLTAMYGLDHVVPLWVAAIIVAGALLLLAAVTGLMAMRMAKRMSVGPKRSANSIREDVSWARAQLKSSTTSSANAST